jgi:hypothetical protein
VRLGAGAVRPVLDEVPHRRTGRLERREPQHDAPPAAVGRVRERSGIWAEWDPGVPTNVPARAPGAQQT